MENQTIFNQVEQNIDRLVRGHVGWSIPVSHEEILRVRQGTLQISISGGKPIPSDWLPTVLDGQKILCLAGAGGQQAPLLAAAGAEVTILDLSAGMLKRDEEVARREELAIRLEHGNMCDLSRFDDESFDIIINPPSLFYVPDVIPVFRECHRVLRKGGIFIMCGANPTNYICDYVEEGDYYKACNPLPYISFEHENQGDWVEFGHTLESYLGGQIQSGFILTGFFEDGYQYDHSSKKPAFCDDVCFVTRAVKMTTP